MAEHDHPVRDDIDLVDGDFYARDPHEAWAWMRANAPAFHDVRNGVWGITRYEDVKAISRDPSTWSSAGGIRPDSDPFPMMIDMDDPEHLRRRKLVNKGFTPRRVRESEAVIRSVCDLIIDSALARQARGEVVDLVSHIAAPLPMIMIGDALGVAPEDRERLLQWSDDMLCSLSGTASEEQIGAAAAAFGEYWEYCSGAVAARRDNPTDDLLSILVHAEVDGDSLDEDSLVHESLLILIGGDETTRHVISGGVYQLLADRSRWDRLAGDRSAIPSAVEEMLRWVSPIRNMCRTATRDVELHGQVVGAGEKVMLFYPSANRDESVFDRPEHFDIARHPNEHVAFGFGTHFCLGASLARLEIRVMVEQLLDRVPGIDLLDPPTDAGVEPLYRPANFVSGYESVPVSL